MSGKVVMSGKLGRAPTSQAAGTLCREALGSSILDESQLATEAENLRSPSGYPGVGLYENPVNRCPESILMVERR